MKLKIKLPILFLLMFLLMFLLIAIFIVLYIKSLVANEGHMWQGNIFSPLHFQMLLFLSILIGLMFVVLILYFHFNITKPIQVLNSRLTKVNIGYSRTSLQSRRKDEIGELYNHFNEMEERLFQAHKEQVNMIAAIAHDLKTPLTTIMGFMELLSMQKNLAEREKQEHYQLILKKSKHMVELIDAFSAFTKDELTLETIEMKAVEAHRLFEDIAAEYETELSSFDYKMKWNHSFNPKQLIMVNEHMIRRVYGNLFSNAVRYGEKKDLKVYMSGYTRGNYAYFQIEDDGVGVPNQDMSSLFNKFFMVDKSRQIDYGGTGLGLASSKSIIEHHGGKISAFHSNYGGLGIRFRLPLVI
ncbi:ATP-binding protein (plasmid) [Metabacillus halosaccharovorans]|uniref:HAMP domain-containing sensor histidine kinase n=1 Tax=Metabacillus halosaccharovorans TaxID=930124 RepID=UPI00203EE20D|nr:HAMP domain-containing sensor histidine kinase [Metabacillus halosaccharovorans]MCM3444162.1 HAMP domain-containing histidine kinase [Metabacillus halosaccharovorans]